MNSCKHILLLTTFALIGHCCFSDSLFKSLYLHDSMIERSDFVTFLSLFGTYFSSSTFLSICGLRDEIILTINRLHYLPVVILC